MTEWCSDPEDYVDVQLTTAYANNQGSITLEIYAKMTFECKFVCLMVFNATFNNILVISLRSVLLMEESGGPEKTTNLSQVTDKLLSHNVVHLALIEIRIHSSSGDRH